MLDTTRSVSAVAALLGLFTSITRAGAVTSDELLPSYDYIVVGGGTSGLTVANRLSEDRNTTVLVIEAGPFDENEDFITIPGLAGNGVGSRYDWNLSFAPNEALNGRVENLGQGRVVGGSSKINMMTFDRGSRSDYDSWETLGSLGWNWDSFLEYFIKTESFTPATPEITEEYNITVDPSVHGNSGNVQATYSPFYWPTTRNIVEAFRELDIFITEDSGNGQTYGGYFCPHSQDPVTATRSSAREAYYETAENRTNYHLLPETHVTRLLTLVLPGHTHITGVEYAASNASEVGSISANREVILAAGAARSPQLLQISGIGDSALLSSIGVSSVVDLPAVGQNLHDHVRVGFQNQVTAPLVQANLTNNATFAAEARALYDLNRTGPYTRSGGDFLGFLPLTTYSSIASQLQEEALAQDGTSYLAPETPAEVIEGYRAMHDLLTDHLLAPDSALIEMSWGDGRMGLNLQQPYSRGSVQAVSPSVFDAPIIDPRILHNPLDVSFLVEAIRWARGVVQTDAMAELQPVEVMPGANVTGDEDLANVIRQQALPAWHLGGTCKMGSREEGGVVDDQLRVHGLSNLRVVDASIMPLLPAAHPMVTVYAVAEKAADIIRGFI